MKNIVFTFMMAMATAPLIAHAQTSPEAGKTVEFKIEVISEKPLIYIQRFYVDNKEIAMRKYQTSIEAMEAVKGIMMNNDPLKMWESMDMMKPKLIESTGNIPDGVVLGIAVFGNDREEYTYKDNMLHGAAKTYDQSGQLLREHSFLNDKLEGLSKIYYEGSVVSEYYYVDDIPAYISTYSDKGLLEYYMEFENGKVIKYESYDENGNVIEDLLDSKAP